MRFRGLITGLAGCVLIVAGCQEGAMFAGAKAGGDGKWVRIFNGKNLKGWDGDADFWSVKDGVIHGETTDEKRAKNNTFLIWRGGTVRDFQLKLKFRIESGNAGVQFRSRDTSAHRSKWSVAGYQAEVCNEQPQVGFLYEEAGRGGLVPTGKFVVIDRRGNKHIVREIADGNSLVEAGYYKPKEWNEYVITALGNHITLELNGHKTAELIDNDPTGRAMEGLIALQIHMGPPMVVEYKDIYLKRFGSPYDNAEVLFNGRDLSGWRAKPGSWEVQQGVLFGKGRGNIWTKEQYGDFILDLDFKVQYRGNSGIFIRTVDIEDEVQTGIEVQVFDNFSTGGTYDVRKGSCGAIYDCQAPSRNVCNPPGEWNHITITAVDNWINIVMNETPIIDMDLNRWTEARKNPDGTKNKFRTAYKDMARKGYIGFQYHSDPVWCRNVRIVSLD